MAYFVSLEFIIWEILTNALKVMVNNPFKESFYGKNNNILSAFSISLKNGVKTFLK